MKTKGADTDRAAPAAPAAPDELLADIDDYLGQFGHVPSHGWYALLARCRARIAANAALAARCEWQPISTAPRNRKIIVGYANRLGNWRTVMGQFYALVANDDCDDAYAPEGWYEECESNPDGYIYQTEESPTHWLPLPATPHALAQESESKKPIPTQAEGER